MLEWRGSDIPESSVGWYIAVEWEREGLRMGESLMLAMGCVWGGLAGGVFGAGFRFGVLGYSVDGYGRVSINGWDEWMGVRWGV